MIFEKYRKRKWKSKMLEAIHKVEITIKVIDNCKWETDKEKYRNKLINYKGLIGKYSGLLENSEDDLINNINKILKG